MKDIKTPEEIKKDHDCYLLRKHAQELRATARIIEKIADEIEAKCGCNTLSLGDK